MFLKKLSKSLTLPLTLLFEHLFHFGCVPQPWRLAHITPVFKKGDPTLPSNYRPISLTSICCKVMETLIKEHIMFYLLEKKLISKQQHGFMSRRSTCTQLLECVNDWGIAIKNDLSVDVIYVDYSRAFDSVVHSKLLHKLQAYGFHGALLDWIAAFLTGRKQNVVLNRCHSEYHDVLSGIAQGSVLGPVFFILFVNDIADLFGPDTICKLFADDVKLYSVLSNDIANNGLQGAIDLLVTWSATWQLQVNPLKCNLLHLGKHNPGSQYHIEKSAIEGPTHLADLGVEMDQLLKYNFHIDNIISKAYQRIAVLFKGFTSRDPKLLTRAYTTYVRPILEYCSQVWSPSLLKDINALERVQRYFTEKSMASPHSVTLSGCVFLA